MILNWKESGGGTLKLSHRQSSSEARWKGELTWVREDNPLNIGEKTVKIVISVVSNHIRVRLCHCAIFPNTGESAQANFQQYRSGLI